MNTAQIDFEALREKWPSTFVARDRVEDFTGGLITRGTIANLDCRGEGPPRFSMGPRKVAYPVDSFIEWLRDRIQRCSKPRAVKERKVSGQYRKARIQ